ncbi:MAG: serine hydrolase [Clostridia bacterium]|nr:serine hydrolase [Clostridia bacterium]
MEKWARKTVELAAGIFLTGEYNPSVIPYAPQKTVLPSREEKDLPRSYPERTGVTSGRILALLAALEKEKRANIHNLLIAKDGAVISECSHPGFDTNVWHLAHSMSKSITALAVGMLVDDGRLSVDMRVCDLLPEYRFSDERFANITVKNLLNMTSGVRFSEVGSVTSQRWTEDFFASSMTFNPGERFHYNSMNSYILARIASRISGGTLCTLLEKRLFAPLGIRSYFWELGPEGVEKGGWGLYMSSESWCKVGIMMLSGGLYNGVRILSSDWISECTSEQVQTPTTLGNYNYGYQMWVSRDSDAFLFNGMFGQDMWVSPQNRLVVCVNSGNNELFQKSPTLYAIETYLNRDLSNDLQESLFAGDLNDLRKREEEFFVSRHWIRPYRPEPKRGLRLHKRERADLPAEWEELVGRFNFVKNNHGILPLVIRAMQNNLKNTVDGFVFERVKGSFFFTVVEAGVSYPMEVGFSDFKESVIDYHGEKYLVRVMGEAMEDEDRNMLYKIELLFPELPSLRTVKLSFNEDGSLKVRMSEMPNNRIADLYVADMQKNNPKIAFFYELINKRLGKNYVEARLDNAFSPTLIGARVGAVNYTAIMDSEREKLRAGEKTVKIINTVIEKFFHDEDEMDEEDRAGFRTFIVDIMDRIKQKLPAKPKRTAGGKTAAEVEEALLLTDGEGGGAPVSECEGASEITPDTDGGENG